MLQVLAVMHTKRRKLKSGLKINYEAQTIVSELDEGVPKNLDYLLSVNLLTAYILLLGCKPTESLEFLAQADRIAHKIIRLKTESFFTSSQTATVLLSNYFLSINLMIQICHKATSSSFDQLHAVLLEKVKRVETQLSCGGDMVPLSHLLS